MDRPFKISLRVSEATYNGVSPYVLALLIATEDDLWLSSQICEYKCRSKDVKPVN